MGRTPVRVTPDHGAPTVAAPSREMVAPYLVAAAVLVGYFMDLLDTTIVTVALPPLGRQFVADTPTLAWVVTGYLLSLAVWIPAATWFGDRFGAKRTYLAALALFTAGSALCGLAPTLGALILCRVLQGVGGGLLLTVGTALIFRAFPPQERARASAIIAVPTVLAYSLAPPLGGWLVDHAGWRWLFFINLPVGLLGLLAVALVLREVPPPGAGRFDLPGFLCAVGGLALGLYAVSRGPADGWGTPHVLGAGLGGLALLAALVAVERRAAAPLLELRLFGDRLFRSANLAFFLSAASLVATLFLLPLFLQGQRGLSALASVLTILPQGLGVAVAAPLADRLYTRVGPRRLIALGLAGTAVATALLALVDLGTDLWWLRALILLRGVAIGLTIVPVGAATFAAIAPADMGRASALFNANRQVASAVGVAVLATVLAGRTRAHVATALAGAAPTAKAAAARQGALLGFHDACAAAVLIALLGVACAFLIRDEDVMAPLRRQPDRAPEPLPEM